MLDIVFFSIFLLLSITSYFSFRFGKSSPIYNLQIVGEALFPIFFAFLRYLVVKIFLLKYFLSSRSFVINLNLFDNLATGSNGRSIV